MKIPAHLDPTIVTANGRIIHEGKPTDGLVVVDGETNKPVISFDEVTGDDDVIHVFCKFAPGAAFGLIDYEHDTEKMTIVGSDGYLNSHEILIRRHSHQPLTPVTP